ncbi:MAG: hypothetical protein PSN04_09410 [Methyloprofundus sp.]|nr:hypothetical protein [Methyloprofundus sp.]
MVTKLKTIITASAVALILQSNFLFAAECNFIRLLKNKSPGTDVLKSNCSKENTLSISNQLLIVAGGRIWMESGESEASLKQQLICQNRSSQSIQLKVTDLQSPWVSTENLKDCNTWVNNRLICDVAAGEKFFCMTAELKIPPQKNQKQERTTSVSMRSLAEANESKDLTLSLSNEEIYIKSAIREMQAEVNLCRELYNSKMPIEIFWEVKAPNRVSDVSVLTEENTELGSCIKDIITNYQYPEIKQAISFVHEF